MDNKITQLFKDKEKDILSVFFTAGFPNLDNTSEILLSLQECGVDMVEVGMPYSDPLADGPTIQKSSEVALENGMNLDLLFEQLADVKEKVKMPILLMGYYNNIYQFGIERFAEQCSSVGVSGLIIPDLPMDEYLVKVKPIFDLNGLINVFLVTPQTSEERIKFIDQKSDGFIYIVASSSITGAKSGLSDEQVDYFKKIKALKLKTPIIAGFGISSKSTFYIVCQYLDGAIIGSAFIKAISKNRSLKDSIPDFIKSVK